MGMRSVIVAVCAACSSTPASTDVVGPFPTTIHRYAMDVIHVPATSDEARQLADDLDGDGSPDNAIGSVSATLVALTDGTMNAQDMIDAGALASSLELAADSLDDAAIVGVTFRGADSDDGTPVGGSIHAGVFASNRSRNTRVPGAAVVRLPVFEGADPAVLPLVGVEIDLSPDGAGGYDAIVRGGVRPDDARAAAFLGVVQMLEANPQGHLSFERATDVDGDGAITEDEFAASQLISALLAPDVQMFAGDAYAPTPSGTPDTLSVGFGAHFIPCDAGACATAPPADACHDRARDGDETDVDCGGSCAACAAGATCVLDGDCQTMHCDTGACRAPSCSDGLRDGYESDVDCGANCPACAAGLRCAIDADCASGSCTAQDTCR